MLALLFSATVIYLLLHRLIPRQFQTGSSELLEIISPYLFPTLLHIILSFIGMIPALYLPPTSRNEIERKLMPPMYLSMTLSHIPVIAQVMAYKGTGFIGIGVIARLYVFATLFTMILMLFMGLFHLGINTSKIFQFTVLAALGSILITVLVPLSAALHPMDPSQWIVDRQFYFIPVGVGVLASFNYFAIYFREQSQHALFQSGSLILIIGGYLLHLLWINPTTVWVGTILFAIGIVIGIPRGRFSQIQ